MSNDNLKVNEFVKAEIVGKDEDNRQRQEAEREAPNNDPDPGDS